MNIYTTEFFAVCPVNGARIKYELTIETTEVIKVEQINDEVLLLDKGFHEDFADQLIRVFGGKQTLKADHHGVRIHTIRTSNPLTHQFVPSPGSGYMADVPGY